MIGAEARSADLVVVGCGVAGLTAARFAAAHGVDVIAFEHMAPGGQIAAVDHISNVADFPEGVAGHDLGPLLQHRAEEAGVNFVFDTVERIGPIPNGFRVSAATTVVTAKAVIVAAGSHLRALNAPGESELTGRGVSHCASCDGPLFRGETVVVVGGGDSAFDEALVLAKDAADVVIVHAGAEPTAHRPNVERVSALPNVRVIGNGRVTAIEGDGAVQRIIFEKDGKTTAQACTGVFIYVGLDPNSAFLGALVDRDGRGAVLANGDFQTRTNGLFVVGDIRSGAIARLDSIASDAEKAAAAALQFLSTRG